MSRGISRIYVVAIVAICIIAIASVAVYFLYLVPPAPETIKFAHLDSFTPPGIYWAGEEHKDAIDMYVDKINAEGGLLGMQIEIIREDYSGTPEKAVAAFEKLRLTDHVAWLGPFESSCSIAVIDRIEDDGRPCFPYSWTDEIRKPHLPNLFHTAVYNSMFAVKGAEWIIEKGWTSTIMIVEDTDWGTGVMDIMKPVLEDAGVQVKPYVISKTTMDFTPYLFDAKETIPDLDLVIGLFTPEPAIFGCIEQANEIGVCGPGTGVPWFDLSWGVNDPEELWPAVGEVGLGIITYTSWHSAVSPSPVGETLIAEYEQKYQKTASEATHVAFNSIIALIEGIRIAGSTEPEAIIHALETNSFVGTTGILTFKPAPTADPTILTHHQTPLPVFICQYQEVDQDFTDTIILWPKEQTTGELLIP